MDANANTNNAVANTGAGEARGRIVDVTGEGRLPIGSDSFDKVAAGCVFVDKTPLVRELLDASYEVVLFCRPRRFGKSLAMRMLQSFLEAPVEGFVPDRRALFEPMAIWRAGERYRAEQGASPVVFLTLNDVKKRDWPAARDAIAAKMAAEYQRHAYVLEGDALPDPDERAYFERVKGYRASDAELARSLLALTGFLHKFHKRRCVVLVDEYDTPVTAGHLFGYYDEVVGFMRDWLTGALKTNEALRIACLSGVQRISKESIFSGLNNLEVSTPLDERFRAGFGFSAGEAAALAEYRGCGGSVALMRQWYDGYCFGGQAAYNPWSVLQFLDKGCQAQVYWGNTSDNAVVHDLVQRADEATAQALYGLVDGGEVEAPLKTDVVFGELAFDPDAIWSQLYLAGYLTTCDVALPNDVRALRRLRMPNLEVAQLFASEIVERSARMLGGRADLTRLQRALSAGDESALAACLENVLLRSASYYDLRSENSYHMLVLGLCFGAPGYSFPTSNREAGAGRYDMRMLPDPARVHVGGLPAVVIEVKTRRPATPAGKWDEAAAAALRTLAQGALEQAEDRSYGEGLGPAPWSGGEPWSPAPGAPAPLLWGIAFDGKHAACLCRPKSA